MADDQVTTPGEPDPRDSRIATAPPPLSDDAPIVAPRPRRPRRAAAAPVAENPLQGDEPAALEPDGQAEDAAAAASADADSPPKPRRRNYRREYESRRAKSGAGTSAPRDKAPRRGRPPKSTVRSRVKGAATMTAGMLEFVDETDAAIVKANADNLADGWAAVAERHPGIERALENLETGGVYGAAILSTAAVVLPIIYHHAPMVLPPPARAAAVMLAANAGISVVHPGGHSTADDHSRMAPAPDDGQAADDAWAAAAARAQSAAEAGGV